MKRSRFTESRIAGILKEAPAGLPVELCCQHQLSGATHYKWKSKYGGLEASELKRLKELESGNHRLKQMYTHLSLEHEALRVHGTHKPLMGLRVDQSLPVIDTTGVFSQITGHMPPSRLMAVPVMYAPRAEQRKVTKSPYSSVSPTRPSGTFWACLA